MFSLMNDTLCFFFFLNLGCYFLYYLVSRMITMDMAMSEEEEKGGEGSCSSQSVDERWWGMVAALVDGKRWMEMGFSYYLLLADVIERQMIPLPVSVARERCFPVDSLSWERPTLSIYLTLAAGKDECLFQTSRSRPIIFVS